MARKVIPESVQMECPICAGIHWLRKETFVSRVLNGYLDNDEIVWCASCLQGLWFDS